MTSEDIKRKLIETLKQNNLKLTRQRLEIVEALAKDRSHPSARMIFDKAREKGRRRSGQEPDHVENSTMKPEGKML
ncbi:MAG: hypothetical protein ABSA46_18625 [Thermodesulfovibrionales bacterium]|jgi:Fe2+ or Zn2+ uptake regulation protein